MVVLAPTARLTPDALERAAVEISTSPPDFPLRLGGRVKMQTHELVAVEIQPAGARALGSATEFRLRTQPVDRKPTGSGWVLAVLLDDGPTRDFSNRRPTLSSADPAVALRALFDFAPAVGMASVLSASGTLVRLHPMGPVERPLSLAAPGAPRRADEVGVVDAMDVAMEDVLRAVHEEPTKRRAVLLRTTPERWAERREALRRESATRRKSPPGANPDDALTIAIMDAGRRFQRLGVILHAWVPGGRAPADLAAACRASGGTVVESPEPRSVAALFGGTTTPQGASEKPTSRARGPSLDLVLRVLSDDTPLPIPRPWKPRL
jgi:hypothetical protein